MLFLTLSITFSGSKKPIVECNVDAYNVRLRCYPIVKFGGDPLHEGSVAIHVPL
jgi:hypothetical protein